MDISLTSTCRCRLGMHSCDIVVAPFERVYMLPPDNTNWMAYAEKSMHAVHIILWNRRTTFIVETVYEGISVRKDPQEKEDGISAS